MNDTICAPATAPGGALGIIRISGSDAFPIVSALCPLCCDTIAANTVHFTRITIPPPIGGGRGEVLDEVVLSIFHAPHSYTGEDTVEISCHGSSYITNKILQLLVQNGCRMAHPGEFTQRAYLNRKMDLSQAEAVADLIASTNKATHDIAMNQLRGHFSSDLSKLRDQLLKLTSLLELELDFSDHEDLEFADRTELLTLAQTIDAHIIRLARSFETGQALKQGIPVAIVGKTNVGKSTLLNALLHDDRAIVSDIHGTTRDTIEDTIDIQGVTFRFIDTAGIRQTDDKIELMGIERTYQMIDKARIILWLIDQQPTEEEQQDMETRCQNKKLIIVCNKSDKGVAVANSTFFTPFPTDGRLPVSFHSSLIKISAKHGHGLEALERAIYQAADIPTLTGSDIIVTNARHYDALTHAHDNLSRVLSGLETQLSGDLIAEDLRLVISNLAEITGEEQITSQETLNNIFSHFCVGK